MWDKLIKYGLIGICNALIDFGIYWLLVHIFKITPIISHIFAWLFAVQFSYIFNSLITFKQSWQQLKSLKKWFSFILSGWAALLASTLTLYFFLPYAGADGAKILAIFSSFAVGFIINNFIVFKEQP